MYAIEVERVTKIYGRGETAVTAISDATFQIKPGELVAILGPSGSGKTTLLTAIGLINEPTHGKVIIDGTTVADEGWLPKLDLKRIRREKLGFIFQAHNLIPFLSVLDNVLIASELVGTPRKEAAKKAMELLEYLEVAHRADKFPATLSGGEKQRVAIARALVHGPTLILADEPTAALDTERGKKVVTLLKELAKKRGVGVVAVTHDVRMVEGFDKVYHMDDGVLSA